MNDSKFGILLVCFCWLGILNTEVARGQDAAAGTQTEPASPAATDSESESRSSVSDLPLLEDMKIPTMETLLNEEPVDWIILKIGRVIVSRPISPRPNTLIQLEKELDKLRQQPLSGDAGQRAQQLNERKKYMFVSGGFLGGGASPEFLVAVDKIETIWHHEDLIVKRIDLQLNAGELDKAYELLVELRRIKSDWPGLTDAHKKLFSLDGKRLLEEGRSFDALVRFEDLFQIQKDYPNLEEHLGQATDALIAESLNDNDYRRGRHFLHRLESRIANHPVIAKWTQTLQEQMETKLAESQSAFEKKEYASAVELARDATRIWPYDTALLEFHRRLNRRYQGLRVGVFRTAGSEHAYPLPLPSDERFKALTQRSLFEIMSYDDTPRYRTPWLEYWEPTELGRNLELRLQTGFDYWNSQESITAMTLARAFVNQLQPGHENYDERLSGFIRAVRVLAPHRLEIQFARAPLRPQALLSREVLNPNTGQPETPFFTVKEQTDSSATFIRHVPEPEEAETYHVAEIQEVAYPDRSSMLKALLRGEVDLLADVALQHVNALRDHPSWITHQYALPRTHLLQFHPSSLPFRSPELRRALLYALNRDEMLDQIVLKDLPKQWGRVVTAPFSTKSYAYSPQSRAVVPDMRVGLSLALAAAKNNDNTLPILRMIAPPDDELKPVLDEMIERWRRIGLQVRLLNDDESKAGEWDIAYRTIVMPEPLIELWPFLTLRNSARVTDLQLLPGWLRQRLIELDLITNWDDATALLHRIHENLWEEVFYIPLWETERFLVHRRGIEGIPERPVHTYDSLELWTAEPWFDRIKP